MSGGVSVDMGGPSQVDLDFRAIYEGGQNFLARAQALAELKSQQEISYANLRVGTDARAALDDAQRKQSDASAKLQEAIKALDDARQTAADIVAKAKEAAAVTIAAAKAHADEVVLSAVQTRDDADTYADRKRKVADTALQRAETKEAAVEASQRDLTAALLQCSAEKDAADQARAEADAAKAKFEQKVADLHVAINKVKAS